MRLDELQEKYGAQGLTVVALTREDRSAVDAFVAKTNSKHAIVIVERDLASEYGVKGYPSFFLVGADGRVVASDMPTDGVIEENLKGVRLFPGLTKKFAAVQAALDREKYADALGKLEKILAGEVTEEEKAAGERVREWIAWSGTTTVERAKAMAEKKQPYEAACVLEDAVKAYKGLPVAVEAQKALQDLLADKEAKEEVAAGRKLADVRKKAAGLTPTKALLLYKPLVAKYKDMRAGAKAAAIVADLEREKDAVK